uniref:C2H2-type domain-containing protein n=1 Tax=Ciona savignyi TaxID=51511 RepID=H2ZEI4_CIOSA
MLQQQQMYQVQMLNFLHLQLTVIASNPQGARNQPPMFPPSKLPGMNGFQLQNVQQLLAAAASMSGAANQAPGSSLMPSVAAAIGRHFSASNPLETQQIEEANGPCPKSLEFEMNDALQQENRVGKTDHEERPIFPGNFSPPPSVPLPRHLSEGARASYDERRHDYERGNVQNPPSETSKLQQLVDQIDKGKDLEKNECHICHRVLSCQSALKLHYRTHTGERPYKCDLCSRAFTTRGNLRTHYSSVHRQQLRSSPPTNSSVVRGSSLQCPLCGSRFMDQQSMRQHMHMHLYMHSQQQQQGNTFTIVILYEISLTKIAEGEDRGDTCLTIGLLAHFMNGHHNDTRFPLMIGGKYGSSGDGDEHEMRMPLNPEENNFSSKLDGDRSELNDDVFDGRSSERDTSPYDDPRDEESPQSRSESEEPGPRGAYSRSLTPPSEKHHEPSALCDRGFTTKGNLKQHLLTHNINEVGDDFLEPVDTSPIPGGRPSEGNEISSAAKRTYPRHWCHICQKQFSSASSLQIHNRTHTGEKPFACSVCGRAFTTKGNLKVHMGTHVWGAGGSRRGRRISMDNPLISPWMQNTSNSNGNPQNQTLRVRQTAPHIPPVADPAMIYQQYAALASGLMGAKASADSRFHANGMINLHNAAAARLLQPPSNGHVTPASAASLAQQISANNAVNSGERPNNLAAASEWIWKAYQRTQEQVN